MSAPLRNAATRRYRWAVLVLAAGYFLYQFKAVAAWEPGWQFRYLTIWALTASLASAWATLRFDRGEGPPPYVLASVAAVFNAVVVLMYWKLFFTDPALVNGDGPILWWQEYYLHLLGPVLQWIDALLLLGAFRRPLATLAAVVAVTLAYIGWAELVVRPLNDAPAGSVTSGLPYPFLNDMAPAERLRFYLTTTLTTLGFTALGVALTWARGWIIGTRRVARG